MSICINGNRCTTMEDNDKHYHKKTQRQTTSSTSQITCLTTEHWNIDTVWNLTKKLVRPDPAITEPMLAKKLIMVGVKWSQSTHNVQLLRLNNIDCFQPKRMIKRDTRCRYSDRGWLIRNESESQINARKIIVLRSIIGLMRTSAHGRHNLSALMSCMKPDQLRCGANWLLKNQPACHNKSWAVDAGWPHISCFTAFQLLNDILHKPDFCRTL